MFETRNVSCYLAGMAHKTIKIGQDEYKGTVLSYRIEPFTGELASDLGSEFKRHLFKGTDADVNPHIDSITFVHAPKPQRIEMRDDPLIKPSVTLSEAKIGRLRARRVKDGNHLALSFSVTVPELSGQELLWLKDALFSTRFLSFDDAQPGLFAEAEAEARRESKDAAPVRRGRRRKDEDEEPASVEAGPPHEPDFDDDGHEQAADDEGQEHARTLPRRRRKATEQPAAEGTQAEATH